MKKKKRYNFEVIGKFQKHFSQAQKFSTLDTTSKTKRTNERDYNQL